MKIWVVVKIARQIEGEYVFSNVEKVFDDLSKVDNYLKSTQLKTNEDIQTPTGTISCFCHRCVFETKIE